ncbi:response regulator transcription factor [Baekduia soli]|uniref:Response regulator transcription factor n=1 Tax=Baekduia soli TaxID=496014 RepID=A0A5B8U3X0_9ACTN|nr:response regulator transcription factor [Baekduia soli]QEC47700.1 response regulator transcription factor [Baekduia soli]
MSVPLVAGVLIADDHVLVRRGLRHVLDAAPDLRVVAEAQDGIEAVRLGLAEDVDLAILDVAMPRRTGLQAARELLRHRPGLRVLMLSMHDADQYFFEALNAGAAGYVLKSAADRDLLEACRAALRGEPFLYPPAVRTIIREHLDAAAAGEETDGEVLTRREQEVVKLVAEAHTTEQIAELLTISPRTVERHRENVLAKLGMRDRVQLTRYAIRRGLVEP